MVLRLLQIVILLQISIVIHAQHKVRWIVKSSQSLLEGATISTSPHTFLITDHEGKAVGSFNPGWLKYQISFIGYSPATDSLYIADDTTITVSMVANDLEMEEVLINANSLKNQLKETSTGHLTFDLKEVADLPYLLGEQDPIKFIQTQTGVSTGTDGNNGYYVRGGGIDQNKIELDHIELYNTNHLFGFFSTFKADAIKSVNFYKSGYPANIGGRLSSTLQLNTFNPNLEKVHGSLGIGLLAAEMSLEVPVIKNTSSIFLSGRRSYFDLITQNLLKPESEIRQRTDYHFSDLIFKYYHKIGNQHTLTLTGFTGADDYFYQSDKVFSNTINWNTYNVGLNWQWVRSSTFMTEAHFNTGVYHQQFGGDVNVYVLDLQSDISNGNAGVQFYQEFDKHELTYGLETTFRDIKPNQATLTLNDEIFTLSSARYVGSLESAVFIDDEVELNDQWRFGIGIRASNFIQLGPFNRFVEEGTVVTDTISYSKNDIVKTYTGLEPRLRVNYLVSPSQSYRFSYDRNYQYIHLSPLSSVSLPTDIWVPSSAKIKPQSAHQFTFGYQQLMNQRDWKWSISIYYKLLENQLEYRNGAIIGYDNGNNFDDAFIFGRGRSYGTELSVQKETGPFKYQVNYTLSRTERIFDQVNNGEYFPAKYDRTHDLNVVGSYSWNNWTFSGLFKLSSGNALTLPTAKYVINEKVISEYTGRNAFRMPVYHRMDLAASLHPKGKENITWVFSVYNLYNRSNPYYVYFDVSGDVSEYSLDIDLKKVSLFPVLPAINYEFRF